MIILYTTRVKTQKIAFAICEQRGATDNILPPLKLLGKNKSRPIERPRLKKEL